MKSTKKALFSSVLALMLCFTMLLGSTFAWFTDSAVSANNKIVAGTLDVELWQHTETEDINITSSTAPIFSGDILWEPNKTEVVYLSIKNNGTLALKYKVAIEVTEISDHDLTEVMYYAITPDAKIDGTKVTEWVGDESDAAKKLNAGVGITETDAVDVELAPGAEHFFALSVHMDDEATNKYQSDYITFDIKVLAGQATYEEDSFGDTYDEFAGYPGAGFAPALKDGETGVEIPVMDDNGDKVGSILVPAGAAADANAGFEAKISKTDYKANITVAAGMETVAYEVTVSNIKEGNTAPVKAQLRIAAGLDPATVKLYHYDEEIPCTYNPETGYVTFETTDFSPFTVVFDAESEYVPAPALPEDLPAAKVESFDLAQTPREDNDIDWGSYGQWSPTEGLDSELEAAYVFTCLETLEEAKLNPYANWNCDFYVMLDKDLGANQIFLGGNYGSFGWVGFHNGELTLDANTEIPMLGSVAGAWTYLDVVQSVGTFICGVGDVDDALSGATFTVMLRLTNPDNEAEFYNVQTVTYTFQ